MKSNFNLPKVDSFIGSTPSRDTICDLFPRGEHPDERTAKEFFRDMENKIFKRKYESRKPNTVPVICITDGRTYAGVRIAEKAYGIHPGNLGKHLRGERSYGHVKGLRFKYL